MIRPTYETKLMSSFLLWADHLLLETGQAWTNWGSQFWRISGNISPYYTYAAPYRPFVADKSIPGATVMSGIYLNNSFITTGQSGFVDINYEKGLVYFSSPVTGSLSGNYAVKDFSVVLTDKPEEKLLIETKHFLKPRVGDTATGLALDVLTYPVLYVKNMGGENSEFSFGGHEKTETKIRVVILADSLWARDGVQSLFKDKVRSLIGIFNGADMPFNSLGGLKSGSYDYNRVVSGRFGEDVIFINRVNTSVFSQEAFQDLNALNTEVYIGFSDILCCSYRYPRS